MEPLGNVTKPRTQSLSNCYWQEWLRTFPKTH